MENNNKLIAEFMGLKEGKKYLSPSLDAPESIGMGMYVSLDEMRYHTSWDWLMPVVQKCYKIDSHEAFNNLVDAVAILDIDATYKAVVQFIEYVNQNK